MITTKTQTTYSVHADGLTILDLEALHREIGDILSAGGGDPSDPCPDIPGFRWDDEGDLRRVGGDPVQAVWTSMGVYSRQAASLDDVGIALCPWGAVTRREAIAQARSEGK